MAAKTGTYTLIASATASGSTGNIAFTSIPQTYTDLVLVAFVKQSTSAYLGYIRLNGDTNANFSETLLYGTGSTAGSARESNRFIGYVGNWTTGNVTSVFTTYVINFMDYSNTTTFKTYISRGGDSSTETNAVVNLWRSTAAINTIDFSVNIGNLASGSTFKLYGIEAGNL